MNIIHKIIADEDYIGYKIFDVFIVFLILISVTLIILETVPKYGVYAPWFQWAELIVTALFTIEYAMRIYSAPQTQSCGSEKNPRLAFLRSPLGVIDLLAIIPFYAHVIFGLGVNGSPILRLLRVLKILRHSSSIDLLFTVLRKEARSFMAAISVMSLLIVLAATMMYWVEHQVQPEAFSSIPSALWWATVTLTTVGYGDVYPITPIGRTLGMLITVMGVGMAALPAGILASGFTHELNLRKEMYKKQVKEALADGALSEEERKELDESAKKLNIAPEQAKTVIDSQEEKERNAADENFCAYCGQQKK